MNAACIGEDPSLFDQRRYPEALPALAICATCSDQTLCLTIVRPQRSKFDGVAGGKVWRNGYQVRRDNTTREGALTDQEEMSA